MSPVLVCFLLSLCLCPGGHLSDVHCNVGHSLQKLFIFPQTEDFEKFKIVNSSVILECIKKDYLSGGNSLISIGIKNHRAFCVEQGSTDGFAFTSIARWPKKLAGACEDHKCHPGYMCVPLTRGSTCQKLERQDVESCEKPSKESCEVTERKAQIRKSYDCTLNRTVQYTRLAATSESSRLHIFNHTLHKFEAFDKKVSRYSEYVIDFNNCKVIYIFKLKLVVLGLNRNSFVTKTISSHMRLLRFFQSTGKLALIKEQKHRGKNSLCIYDRNLTQIVEVKHAFKNVGDISFNSDGKCVFVLEKYTSRNRLLRVNEAGGLRILGRQLRGDVLMHGTGSLARWDRSSHTLVIGKPGNETKHLLTQDVSEIYSSLHGTSYLVDRTHMLYAYNSHMKFMWKTSLSKLYGQKKGRHNRVGFYFE